MDEYIAHRVDELTQLRNGQIQVTQQELVSIKEDLARLEDRLKIWQLEEPVSTILDARKAAVQEALGEEKARLHQRKANFEELFRKVLGENHQDQNENTVLEHASPAVRMLPLPRFTFLRLF